MVIDQKNRLQSKLGHLGQVPCHSLHMRTLHIIMHSQSERSIIDFHEHFPLLPRWDMPNNI